MELHKQQSMAFPTALSSYHHSSGAFSTGHPWYLFSLKIISSYHHFLTEAPLSPNLLLIIDIARDVISTLKAQRRLSNKPSKITKNKLSSKK
jgi:hypothetical protein